MDLDTYHVLQMQTTDPSPHVWCIFAALHVPHADTTSHQQLDTCTMWNVLLAHWSTEDCEQQCADLESSTRSH